MKKRVLIHQNEENFVINVIGSGTPTLEDTKVKEDSIIINRDINGSYLQTLVDNLGLEVLCWIGLGNVYGWVESSKLEELKQSDLF